MTLNWRIAVAVLALQVGGVQAQDSLPLIKIMATGGTLLMLALTGTGDPKKLQRLLNEF